MAANSGNTILALFLLVVIGQLTSTRAAALEEDSGNQEFVPQGALLDQQQDLRRLAPSLQQTLDQVQAAIQDRDDYHSNIDGQKLSELAAAQYEIIPAPTFVGNSPFRYGDSRSLSRLFSNLVNFNRANEFAKSQVERKRSLRQRLAGLKEDKDYSFVGDTPANKLYSDHHQMAAVAAANNKWTAQKLRDMILSHGQALRYAADDNSKHFSDQLSQFKSRSVVDLGNNNSIDNNEDSNEAALKNRDKRRRCKVDPNLSVKNPAFCDTDAYLKATEYGNVWDMAGR